MKRQNQIVIYYTNGFWGKKYHANKNQGVASLSPDGLVMRNKIFSVEGKSFSELEKMAITRAREMKLGFVDGLNEGFLDKGLDVTFYIIRKTLSVGRKGLRFASLFL